MRAAGEHPDGIRLRGVIVMLWLAGLRIREALALTESDLDRSRGAVLVRWERRDMSKSTYASLCCVQNYVALS
jgi:integrase